MTQTRPGRTVETSVTLLNGSESRASHDLLATEEPLELRLSAGGETRELAVTMRTPGNDFEFAAGFAFGEGIVASRSEIRAIRYCDAVGTSPFDSAASGGYAQGDRASASDFNVVTIDLARGTLPDTSAFERHFTVTSACGVCGRAELQALHERTSLIEDDTRLASDVLAKLPERMREAQDVFSKTGGLHAAALFDTSGTLLALREDVGRHNAVDKLVGWALLDGRMPLIGTVLMVSGRTSYEIVQKALVARIPIVAAVSAPSSLAVAIAREFNITLCGFVRHTRANIYSANNRINAAC